MPHLLPLLAITAAAGVLAVLLGRGMLMDLALRLGGQPARLFAAHLARPGIALLILLAVKIVTQAWTAIPRFAVADHVLALGITACATWLLIGAIRALSDFLAHRFDLNQPDNLRARGAVTQVRVAARIAVALISLLGVASALMTFDAVRQIGTGLLASAGIAGIVVGFAAQRSLGTLFAGIQIALTQPIRIDDVVIVEGEWGRIEEITLTYVVVRIWDLRRLVVPITWFIEKPFQNWTRVSADLLGTVMLYTDFSVPIEAVRAELDRILDGHALWDGKVKNVQVTDMREQSLELRVMVSAAHSSALWDLRVDVREKLVDFLRRDYPRAFARVRADTPRAASIDPVGET